VAHLRKGDATRGPVLEISAHAAAVGLTFYTGPQALDFEGDALIATWGPGVGRSSYAHNLLRVRLTPADGTYVGVATPFVTGLTRPTDVAVGPRGDIFISDHVGRRIYRVSRR
jgi:glucose/arabinose dehydrogenase